MWSEDTANEGEKAALAAAFVSSVVLYGGFAVLALAGMAALGRVVASPEAMDVTFAPRSIPVAVPIAEAPAAKSVRKPPRTRRKGPKKARQDTLAPPTAIPDDAVESSLEELANEGAVGPVEGSLDGVEDGDGSSGSIDEPAPELPSGARPPAIASRPSSPLYPAQARSERVQGVVLVRCLVTVNGENRRCRAIRGHALLRDAATAYVALFSMRPATTPDGVAAATTRIFPVRFEARNL